MGQLYFEKFQYKGFDCFIEQETKANSDNIADWRYGLVLRKDSPFLKLGRFLSNALTLFFFELRRKPIYYFMDCIEVITVESYLSEYDFDNDYEKVIDAFEIGSDDGMLVVERRKGAGPKSRSVAKAFKSMLTTFVDLVIDLAPDQLFENMTDRFEEIQTTRTKAGFLVNRLRSERDEARQYTETLQHRIVELQRRLNSER